MKTVIFWILIVILWIWLVPSSSSESNGGSYSNSSGNYYDSDNYYDEESYEEDVVTSDNWDCTGDCSGHEAGYEWASNNGITDSYDCDGNSDSFIEGCEAYANEYQLENEEEEEYYEEDYGYY